ncbi:Type 1 glutamine amidotransferase-like domain-containing protein [Mycobacterium arosiense]|uniref:Peptidase n=1 Tax=Mycobacterium arosiense ATCC BAA-1401 = DSM 45069 TaxID=1265311 RepID=A0A1W9Z5U5_MYCAI|nr:Type 1 glutamine amidotransferase-like domain-containing protein [Mycobacterium arosiense]ORA07712.1 peptidase [Mycobacterium arosiense ATCC BAA-1401 = DSM 45069]
MTAPQCQPLYLLADSQLLFWKRHGRLLLETALDGLACDEPPSAAYIGASNGDRAEFYEIFEAAMDAVAITDRSMVASSFGPDDRAFLERAQLIVLAGGDVCRGWTTFEATGMKDVILNSYVKGAVLVGVSAGAVQLGRYAVVDTPETSATELPRLFDLVPLIIDAHDEQAGWARLSRTIQLLNGSVTGLGIPTGGGVIAYPGGTIEPLRHPAHTFTFEGPGVTHSLVPPKSGRDTKALDGRPDRL